MGIIGWIVLGLIIGALAKLAMTGKDRGGILTTTALGVLAIDRSVTDRTRTQARSS